MLARVTSEKQLNVVFRDGSPQSKESAEPRLAQAIGDDYATGRGCVLSSLSSPSYQIPLPQPTKTLENISFSRVFLFLPKLKKVCVCPLFVRYSVINSTQKNSNHHRWFEFFLFWSGGLLFLVTTPQVYAIIYTIFVFFAGGDFE